jgi:hypothetical protein
VYPDQVAHTNHAILTGIGDHVQCYVYAGTFNSQQSVPTPEFRISNTRCEVLSPFNSRVTQAAKKKRTSGTAVTVHDTVERVTVALELVEDDANFMAVVGVGIRTDTGDVIGLLTNKGTKAKDSGDSVHEIEGRVPSRCCQTSVAVIYLLGMEIL